MWYAIHVWHDSFACEWLFICEISLICDMTHLYVNDYPYVKGYSYVTWLIYMCQPSAWPAIANACEGSDFFPQWCNRFSNDITHLCATWIMYESCPMIHMTWVMSHMHDLCYLSPYARFILHELHESCPICMVHVTCVMSHMNESCHMIHSWVKSHVPYERIMSQMQASNHTLEWIMWQNPFIRDMPLTEEIRLEMFGSRDLSVSRYFFWVTGTPFTQLKRNIGILGTPVKTCLIGKGTPVKTC